VSRFSFALAVGDLLEYEKCDGSIRSSAKHYVLQFRNYCSGSGVKDSWLKKENHEINKVILVTFLKEIHTWDQSSIFFDTLVCITEMCWS